MKTNKAKLRRPKLKFIQNDRPYIRPYTAATPHWHFNSTSKEQFSLMYSENTAMLSLNHISLSSFKNWITVFTFNPLISVMQLSR